MYEIVEKNIDLTADEIDIIKLALERYQETTVSIGETFTVECLLEKLES